MEEIEKLKQENDELRFENTRFREELKSCDDDMYRNWKAGEFMWTSLLALSQIVIVAVFITPLMGAGIASGSFGILGKNLLTIGGFLALVWLYTLAGWFWITRMCTVFKDDIVVVGHRINRIFVSAAKAGLREAYKTRRHKRDEL